MPPNNNKQNNLLRTLIGISLVQQKRIELPRIVDKDVSQNEGKNKQNTPIQVDLVEQVVDELEITVGMS